MLKGKKMSFTSLPMGTLHKKRQKKILKIFPAGYVRKLYRNLADNVDHDFLGSNFYGRFANDYDIPSDHVQKYILATSDFGKGIQTDINHFVSKDRINNASFRQKLKSTGACFWGHFNIWCWKSKWDRCWKKRHR